MVVFITESLYSHLKIPRRIFLYKLGMSPKYEKLLAKNIETFIRPHFFEIKDDYGNQK